jgi:hypothetical protein
VVSPVAAQGIEQIGLGLGSRHLLGV